MIKYIYYVRIKKNNVDNKHIIILIYRYTIFFNIYIYTYVCVCLMSWLAVRMKYNLGDRYIKITWFRTSFIDQIYLEFQGRGFLITILAVFAQLKSHLIPFDCTGSLGLEFVWGFTRSKNKTYLKITFIKMVRHTFCLPFLKMAGLILTYIDF